MPNNIKALSWLIVCFALTGCGVSSSDGPLGAPEESPLLTPFAGMWAFDVEKTAAFMKSSGLPEEQISHMQKIYADNPRLGNLHSDLTINGNVAIGSGPVSCEYRFFSMHEHDAKLCGKAWHHEDRFDPGDMSKCYVRLWLIGNDLALEVNMLEGLPDMNDPDLLSTHAVTGDPSLCDADQQDKSHQMTYVFSRKN